MNTMNNNDRDVIIRALGGNLTESQEKEFRTRYEADAEFRASCDRMRRVGEMVAEAAPTSFGPSFADRVVERMADRVGKRTATLSDMLAPLFARIAPVAVGLAIVLGVYNVVTLKGADQSPIEAALGLPTVTVASAYESQLTPLMTYEMPAQESNGSGE